MNLIDICPSVDILLNQLNIEQKDGPFARYDEDGNEYLLFSTEGLREEKEPMPNPYKSQVEVTEALLVTLRNYLVENRAYLITWRTRPYIFSNVWGDRWYAACRFSIKNDKKA